MNEKEKKVENQMEEKNPLKPEWDDWATQAREDMEDFIESQGVYLRQ